jgi:hypothetical protein
LERTFKSASLKRVALRDRIQDLTKSRALGVGLIMAQVLLTALAARFLMRRKRNVILGVCVLVADAILLSAAMLLFHFGD